MAPQRLTAEGFVELAEMEVRVKRVYDLVDLDGDSLMAAGELLAFIHADAELGEAVKELVGPVAVPIHGPAAAGAVGAPAAPLSPRRGRVAHRGRPEGGITGPQDRLRVARARPTPENA